MYGLDLKKEAEQVSDKDWILGAVSVKGIAENIDFKTYLPAGEVQRTSKSDTMDCATRSPMNILETKLNYLVKNYAYKDCLSPENFQWLQDNGYIGEDGTVELSDAFTAILSGTTTRGNSLKAPLESMRKDGVIPKKLLPMESWMSWYDYHKKSRITPLMKELGKEFIKRFPINYEKVMKGDFFNVIKWDILNVAGYAWTSPRNGIYPRTTQAPNHAFVYFEIPAYQIFDNYLDTDGDFIKHLASDYNLLHYAYRVIINEVVEFKKKDMTTEQLKNAYQEILMREPDELSEEYLEFDEGFVRNELLRSEERDSIEKWVGFLRSVKLLKGK